MQSYVPLTKGTKYFVSLGLSIHLCGSNLKGSGHIVGFKCIRYDDCITEVWQDQQRKYIVFRENEVLTPRGIIHSSYCKSSKVVRGTRVGTP